MADAFGRRAAAGGRAAPRDGPPGRKAQREMRIANWRPTGRAAVAALVILAWASLSAAADETQTEETMPLGIVQVPESESALRGPVDGSEYIVGPGDRFAMTLWGQDVVTLTQEVTPEGELVLPGVATVKVSGASLDAAKRLIRERIAEFYEESVEVSVSLVELRRMLVSVLGQVDSPGAYVGTAMDPASELIKKAGGLTAGASERNITITRRDGASVGVDLIRYRRTGDLSADPPVLDGDVIFVPQARSYVYVFGAVAQPGRYEFVEGETVGSLLEVAGGFTYAAVTDEVELREFVDDVHTDFRMLNLTAAGGTSCLLSDGDQVYVRSKNEWRRVTRVVVDGEVRNPGSYGINEGVDRLSDVIRRAGGVTEEGSLANARVMRADDGRAVDREFQRLSEVQPGSMTETEYAYYKMRYIGRGESVVTDVELALEGVASQDVLLLDGDRVFVPKRTNTVVVTGQVARPGHVEYQSGKRYGHYIGEAGGYSNRARRGRVTVIRASSGEWQSARRAGELLPGDTLWVPESPETDWWTTVKDVAQFAASVATAYLLIDQATQ